MGRSCRSAKGEFPRLHETNYPKLIVALLVAVTWAVTVVTNTKPSKDSEGSYKTYFGAGFLPPEGYTNSLDPRLNFLEEAETARQEALYKKNKLKRIADKKAAKAAGKKVRMAQKSSAVV